jgi:cysteine-rich repeat protein
MHLLKGALAAALSIAVGVGVVGCGGETDSPLPQEQGGSSAGGAPGSGGTDGGVDSGAGGVSPGGSGGGSGGTVTVNLCGNGTPDPGEECDDANGDNDDGCTSVCRFSCLTDLDCIDTEFCNGQELCDIDTHKCRLAPSNVVDGTRCGIIHICKAGVCDFAPQTCGDEIRVGTEECDPPDPDHGCGLDCRFVCLSGDATRDCTPADKCNGQSTCDDNTHLCRPRTPLGDYTPCGADNKMQCIDGACSHCGDKVVQTNEGEECDAGDRVDGDGCDHNCKWSCVPGSTDRNCKADDICYADGTCNPSTHRCSPILPAPAGKGCGTGKNCVAGNCVDIRCGDGVTALAIEPCDDGNQNNLDGCTNACVYSCVNAATDCKGLQPCQTATCASNICSLAPDAAKDNQPCTAGGSSATCHSGACTAGTCGNTSLDVGEQCDFGAGANVAGSGCEPTCAYSCQTNADCDDGDPCNGVETCVAVPATGSATAGKKCASGTPKTEGDVCAASPRRICLKKNNKLGCVLSICGDGYTDSAATPKEDCDPPNTAGCDESCKGKTPCKVDGTWGMKVTVDVSWGGGEGVLEPHSSQILQWSILTLAQVPSKPTEFTTTNVRVCGIDIPDFQAVDIAGREWYGLRFANLGIWDLPSMPSFSGTGRVSNLYAGAAIDFDAMTVLTGVRLKDPSGPWPEDLLTLIDGTAGSFEDDDNDGHPGVTFTAKAGPLPMTPYYTPPPSDGNLTFSNPVVNLGDGTNRDSYGRGDRIYIGIRALSSESGSLDTCDSSTGQANVASIDNHIPGCHLAPCTASGCTSPGNSECLPNDVAVADAIKPLYAVSNATFAARRLSGATPNCATVRTALP